jgi:ornithine cyclodeaminase/alanine dehydrogenase-like protein (mu-crystallin family)
VTAVTGGIGDRPLLHLSEEQIGPLLPPPLEGIALARRALVALADGTAELPPKPAVHPRENGFANAMPAYLRDGDLLGIKWIAAYPGNVQLGLPSHVGLLVMSDAATGLPLAVMGAATITGARTAAVSGACIEALAPPQPGHVAITAAGVQARTHLAVLDALGRTDVAVVTRGPAATAAITRWADEHVPDVSLTCVGTAAEAVEGAAVVVTAVPIGVEGAHLDPAWLRDDVLLLPIDYATSVTAAVANQAMLFADDVGQLLRYRDAGSFPGYRDPDGYCGDALRRARSQGRVVCQNLGNGAVDLVYADRVLTAALAAGEGTQLRR